MNFKFFRLILLASICWSGVYAANAEKTFDCAALSNGDVGNEQFLNTAPENLVECGGFFELAPDEDAYLTQEFFVDGKKVSRSNIVMRTGKHFYWPQEFKVKIIKTSNKDMDVSEVLGKAWTYSGELKKLGEAKNTIKSKAEISTFLQRTGEYLVSMGLTKSPVYPKEIRIEPLTGGKSAAVGRIGDGEYRLSIDPISISEHNHLMYLHLAHEMIHLQGVSDESLTDLLALALLGEMAIAGEKEIKMAIYGRLIDYVLYAPLFIIGYNDSLPLNSLDLVIKAPKTSSGSYDGAGNGEMLENFFSRSIVSVNQYLRKKEDATSLENWLDWKISAGFVDESQREEERDYMLSLLKRDDFKVAVMKYGLLPFVILNQILSNNPMSEDVFGGKSDELLNKTSFEGLKRVLIN